MNMQFKLVIVPLLLSGHYDSTIVSIVASTVSMLFWNAYVQRYVYTVYREQSGTSHCCSCTNSLNGGFFNDHFGFRHSHKFCLGL